MLNFAKSGLNETLVQFSPSLHFLMQGSDLFPMLFEKTFKSAEPIYMLLRYYMLNKNVQVMETTQFLHNLNVQTVIWIHFWRNTQTTEDKFNFKYGPKWYFNKKTAKKQDQNVIRKSKESQLPAYISSAASRQQSQ